ncbi:MAG: ATP-binding cassette domain-containing protein [Bifidobacterium longum]
MGEAVPWHGGTQNVERVGWVFQNPYGVPGRTALDHVVFRCWPGAAPARSGAAGVGGHGAVRLGYAADRRFSELSGGEAQRLMLARAVCSRPDMLLVDDRLHNWIRAPRTR